MGPSFDVVVIGSGFGGAVTSCRLSEAGLRVLVLERGRRWSPKTYPRTTGDPWIWDQGHPEKRNGWLDFRLQRGVCVAQGAGVGGGSLIYANVLIEAPRELFDSGWPAEVTWNDLVPYYQRVERMMKPRAVPENQVPERLKIIRQAAAASGYETRYRPLPLAISFDDEWHYGREKPFDLAHSRRWINEHGKEQGTCVHCGNCYLGCQVAARNTLDLNYLARAETKGAEVRPLHVVRTIVPEDGRYRVHYERIENRQLVAGSVVADRVIVAAGSLGSTELLLRCRDQFGTLPNIGSRLGHRWSANGDFLTVSIQQTAVNPTHGPSINAAVDFLDGGVGGKRFFVEDGGFPDFLRGVIDRELRFDVRNLSFSMMVFSLAFALRRSGQFPNMMPWFGQAMDAADGQLYLGRRLFAPWRKRLKLKWNCKASRETIDAMVAMHGDFARATGGRPLSPLLWKLLKTLITPHPLGGCSMADTASGGVVDHRGQVFGYRNLFVADGSVIPRAIGLNPSKTIAAVSERIATLMTTEK